MKKNNEMRVAGPTDYLANERTFLAWIRTSIALMGFGFVVVKFAMFVSELAVVLADKAIVPGKGYSAFIGVVMIVLGAVMATLAYLRYRSIEKQLRNNLYFPSKWLSALVTLSILTAGILLVVYLLPSI